MHTRYPCALLNTVTIGILSAQGAKQQIAPLSVCELVANRNQYNGQMVVVRGEVRTGGHGSYLAASSSCHYRLLTRGVEWENFVFLELPSSESEKADHARYRVDWKSIQRAHETVARAAFNSDTDSIIETYLGLFVTYTDLENRVSPGIPGAIRLGFGPVGLEAPAKLRIESVKDVVVAHRATR